MYARVSSLSVPPDMAEAVRRQIEGQAAPAARDLPGMTGALWLLDASSGTLVSVVTYRTQEVLKGNRPASNQIRDRAVRDLGGTVLSVREFEVIAEVR